MRSLELKVPPPVVTVLFGVAMWGIAEVGFGVSISFVVRMVLAVAIALAGAAFSIGGVMDFRRARTTVNPIRPETTSALVTGGVYRFTRNPMYVGFGLFLAAWGVYLSSPAALMGPILFVLYITQFQIKPEERVLLAKFGDAFAAYQARVRRWL